MVVVHIDFKNAFGTMPQGLILSLFLRKGMIAENVTWISGFLRVSSVQVEDSGIGIESSVFNTHRISTGYSGGVLFLFFMEQVKSVVNAPHTRMT